MSDGVQTKDALLRYAFVLVCVSESMKRFFVISQDSVFYLLYFSEFQLLRPTDGWIDATDGRTNQNVCLCVCV